MFRVMPILALFASLALFTDPSHACTLTAGDIDAAGGVTSVDVQLAILAALDVSTTPDADINFDAAFTSVDVQLVILAALDVAIDSDGDGLADAAEESLGTRPDLRDTDGDTIEDGQEVCDGSDPKDPNNPGEGAISGEYSPIAGLVLEDGTLRLDVPPGALDTAVIITMRPATPVDLPAPLPGGVGFAGAVFFPSGLSFTASATVSVQLSSPTIAPALPVVTYDEGLGAWVGTGATATIAPNGIDAEFPLSHFSIAGIPDAIPIPDPGDPIGSFVVLSNNAILETDAISSDSAALLWSEFGDTFSISATSQNINDQGQLETKAIGFTSIAVFHIENYIVGVVGGPLSLFDPGGVPEPAVGVMIMSVKDGNVALSLYAATEKRVIQGTLTSPPASGR